MLMTWSIQQRGVRRLGIDVETVYIALGSNLGDREEHLNRAIERLKATPGVAVVACSSWLETDFVGDGPEQGRFLNGVLKAKTSLPPLALLGVLRALEVEAGRRSPHPRNHPRELDLDVIFYGDQEIDSRELRVPHPRWHERAFVTSPLRELGVNLDQRPRAMGTRLAHEAAEVCEQVSDWLRGGCVVGLVPTMGSLHEGHASLMRRAKAECDRVLATVFVNPLQFGPGEDFDTYPRDLERDLGVCEAAGVDTLFAPSASGMFASEFASHVGVGAEAAEMEGAVREGHFSGVATVVARLFAIARPHRAYFGEKDAQQLVVVRRMCADLGFPVAVVACPIVREPDGLALSSRNTHLTAEDRRAAPVLYRALCAAGDKFKDGLRDRDLLVRCAQDVLATEPRCAVDYVELRRARDLAPLAAADAVCDARMLVAARFGDVRLLDNVALNDEVAP